MIKGRLRSLTLLPILAIGLAAACGGDNREPLVNQSTAALVSEKISYYEGVDEKVVLLRRFANDPMPSRVRRADGTTQRYADFLRSERKAYRQRFGALSPEIRKHIEAAGVSDKIPVAIYFNLDVPYGELERGLRSTSAAIRSSARDSLRQAIADSGRSLSNALASNDIAIRRVLQTEPVAYAELTREQVKSLSRNPKISTIRPNVAVMPTRHSYNLSGTPNTVSYVGTETEFNTLGYYARGQRVGIVESAQCRLYSEHDSMQFAGAPSGPKVVYEDTIKSCTTDSDCTVCDGYQVSASNHKCVSSQCVVDHASSVASVVTASNDGTRHGAAEARLYYANKGHQGSGDSYPHVFCSDEGMADAYQWFVDNEVTTVNESFECGPGVDGVHQDWYAREYGITVVKSAGNDAVRAACPDTQNALCVGSTQIPGDYSFAGAAWRNPSETDREEPDVMALGAGPGMENEGPTIASLDGTNLWVDAVGTSFAAPAVASQVALLKEACGGNIPALDARAILETAAYYINPEPWCFHPWDRRLSRRCRRRWRSTVARLLWRESYGQYYRRRTNRCRPPRWLPLRSGRHRLPQRPSAHWLPWARASQCGIEVAGEAEGGVDVERMHNPQWLSCVHRNRP